MRGKLSVLETDLSELNSALETAYPFDILRWATETYVDKLAVVTSFQPTGIVALHMLSEIAPNTPVLTLDTGLLFPETYTLIDELEKRLHLNLIQVRPEQTVQQQAETHGAELWERDPDLCCNLRKIVPLKAALGGYSAWITGLRRDQSARRQATSIITWDTDKEVVKLSPFATWTESMIWTYIKTNNLPYNLLHDQHYPSIGCYPCTHSVSPEAADKRAGRWAKHDKTECGIHFKTIN